MEKPSLETMRNSVVRPARPFNEVNAGHVLVKAAEELNWSFDDVPKFVRRVQHIEYGLDAETEFAAVVSWLGNCHLVHRLDQKSFSSRPKCGVRIPDLLVVFENYGVQFSALVEVKSERKDKLTITDEYLKSLEQYSALFNQPLLVAWKPPKLGFWLLFDPRTVERNDKGKLDFGEALKHNLMGGLAGDFMVDPYPGFGLTIEAQRTSEKIHHNKGFEAEYTTDRVVFLDHHGSDIGQPGVGTLAVLWATMLLEDKIDSDDRFAMSFLSQGGAIHAQSILRSSVGLQRLENEKIHWLAVAENFDTILSRNQLLGDIQEQIGKLFHTLAFQHPIQWPEFIPEQIRLKLESPTLASSQTYRSNHP